MQNRLTVAAVQMNSGADSQENLHKAVKLVEQAAGDGAQLVALPELFLCLTQLDKVIAATEPIPGPTSQAMSALAARLGIHLLAGSFCERSDVPGKGYNTSLTFGPAGELLNRYRKLHLFDVDLPGQVVIQESQYMLSGDRMVVTDTPLARLGHATCYDLRFPELFRSLAQAGCEIVLIPSAFTRTTGQAHWQVLLRARAIENQCFVVAPNQCGAHTDELISYGHSMIIDPWGQVLQCANGTDEQVVLAELSGEQLDQVRQRLPALKHRRSELF